MLNRLFLSLAMRIPIPQNRFGCLAILLVSFIITPAILIFLVQRVPLLGWGIFIFMLLVACSIAEDINGHVLIRFRQHIDDD